MIAQVRRRAGGNADRGGVLGRLSVNEHRIRLRAGWESLPEGCSDPAQERIDLPIRWGPGRPRRLRLTRRFGRPPLDARKEGLFLELDRVPGMQSLVLNGKSLAAVTGTRAYYLIPLAEIEARNVLEIEIETGEPGGEAAGQDLDWGHIALVIRSLHHASGR